MYAEKLYGLFKNNSMLIAISDDISILKNRAGKHDTINDLAINSALTDYHICKTLPNDIDIIENDDDKDYGVSEISYADSKWDILMHQPRLDINANNYYDALDELRDANKSYWDKTRTFNDIVAKHCDFWMRPNEARRIEASQTIPTVIHLSDDYKQMLLTTGFASDMILLES